MFVNLSVFTLHKLFVAFNFSGLHSLINRLFQRYYYMITSISSKSRTPFLFLVILVISVSACTRNVYVHKTPPGHAKKAAGSKSAKAFAPGQTKKH
jgi:hypothetical protein